MAAIRVLVADDHELVRRGVMSLLACHNEYEVVGEADDGRSAVNLAQELQPDIVLLDITMPGMNGLRASKMIKEVAPHTEVIIISQYDSESMKQEADCAGAR